MVALRCLQECGEGVGEKGERQSDVGHKNGQGGQAQSAPSADPNHVIQMTQAPHARLRHVRKVFMKTLDVLKLKGTSFWNIQLQCCSRLSEQHIYARSHNLRGNGISRLRSRPSQS